mgnify:CR=1 FL=1
MNQCRPRLRLIHVLLVLVPLFVSSQANAHLFDLFKSFLGMPVFKESPKYTTDDNVIIPTYDGLELHGNIFVPTTGESSYPAIIFINSWAFDEYEYLAEAKRFSEDGYVVLSYSTRGFGQSDGTIETAGPEDLADVSAVIDYLVTRYPVDVEAIGVSGISYGSGISLLSAAVEPRIKAVSAMSTWGSLTDSLYGNRATRLVWGLGLIGAGEITGNPNAEINQHYSDLLFQRNIAEGRGWFESRSPINYVDQINANGAAIHLSSNLGDNLFQSNSVLKLYEGLTGPKKLDLNQGTHFVGEVIGMGNENNHVWSNAHDWFDYWLKGIDNGIVEKDRVEMEVKFGDYESFADWPFDEVTDRTLYLHEKEYDGDGDMLPHPYAPWWPKTDTIYSGLDTFATSGIPILSYLAEDKLDIPIVSSMPLISTINAIRWESDWLYETTKLRGIPKVHLTVTPSKSRALLVAYLYDVAWTGVGKLITHAPYAIIDAIPGQKMDVDLDLVATAYDVPAGHYLALVIDTADALYAPPTLEHYNVKINYSSNIRNTLTLPIK